MGSQQSPCSLAPVAAKYLALGLRVALFAVLAIAGVAPRFGVAQQKPDLAGEYAGLLGPLHVKLHLVAAHDGSLSGTVDSPDQGMVGVAMRRHSSQWTSPELYRADGTRHMDRTD